MSVTFTVGWLVWLGAFAVWEGIALFNSKPGDTFSEHVWHWFGFNYRRGQPREVSGWLRVRRFTGLAIIAWLAAHFLTGGLF